MPLYEYDCRDCEAQFELLIRGQDQPACPSCGGKRLDKRFSVPAAHTRGTTASLPICQTPSAGGCGAPWCGSGGCGLD